MSEERRHAILQVMIEKPERTEDGRFMEGYELGMRRCVEYLEATSARTKELGDVLGAVALKIAAWEIQSALDDPWTTKSGLGADAV